MAEASTGLKVSAPIVPYSSIDVYPTHLSIFGKGGLMSVDTVAERNAIPEERREEGMIVYVSEDQIAYALRGGLTNTKWVDLQSFIEGANSGRLKVSVEEPLNPTTTTVWLDVGNEDIKYRDPTNHYWVSYVPPLVDGGEF